MEVYEVLNPSFGDMNIELQIAAGINDWVARDDAGREFFGQTRDEAVRLANEYNSKGA